MPHVERVGDHAIEFRRRDICRVRKPLGFPLVIDQTDETPRVELVDEPDVPLVYSEQSGAP